MDRIGLLSSGSFAGQVAAGLSTIAAGAVVLEENAQEHEALIVVLDAFDPAEARALCKGIDAARLLLCFLTVRGLFVSSWLGPRGPCLTCLERRWLANLAFWEHEPEQERVLRALQRHSPGIGSFPMPVTAVHVAAQLLLEQIDNSKSPGLCHYFDLASCEARTGALFRVHGCPGCAPDRPDPRRRYLHGLADLSRRLRP